MVSGHPAIRFRAALRTGIPRESPFLSVFCRLSAPQDYVTYPGACWSNKKSVDTAQNLENKRPEIFLPARSMVLKVVRGKILETLELRSPHASDSFRARSFAPLEKAGGFRMTVN
jgi:hypothetical protein